MQRQQMRPMHLAEAGLDERQEPESQHEEHLDNIADFEVDEVAVVRAVYYKDDMHNDPRPAFLKREDKKKMEDDAAIYFKDGAW
jgi:hypothetical protein